jgi:hypothetical protein
MKKIELTIKTSYVPTWATWEGVRELIQNGRDAQLEHGGTFTVRHDAETSRLFVENVDGGVLTTEDLLLGQTSKADRGDLAGKFGEGLKLGVLALVRAGHDVVIRSGGEVWRPSIETSSVFKAEVLVFRIDEGRKARQRVRVEVSGITAEDWAEMEPRFRFLSKKTAKKAVLDVPYQGAILLDDAFKGMLFVRGIFVSHDPTLSYGYDLTSSDVRVDRDRKMVESWDLRWRLSALWRDACAASDTSAKATETLADLVFEGAKDVSHLEEDSYHAERLGDCVKDAVLHRFRAEHGDKAHPVGSIQESIELEHAGRKGARVSKAARSILETRLGKLDDVRTTLKNEVVEVFSASDLTADEKAALAEALRLVALAGLNVYPVDVVTFRDADLHGLWAPKERKASIARRLLASWDAALGLLVHEFAHATSGADDGTASHGHTIEDMWRKIAVAIRGER